MEKNYAVTGLLGGEDFYVNVHANSEQEAVEKATENVWSYMPEEEFDILQVEEIDSEEFVTFRGWAAEYPVALQQDEQRYEDQQK